ncbi:MAG: gamma-glutamyl-gamma-aminobutyrate hydrolase family protein [Candidatus Binatia bacterium]
MRPLIGITSYARGGQRESFYVPTEYVDVVRLAGGVPVILPPVEGEVEALSAIDGLMLPGGGDIDPAHYGDDDYHPTNYDICRERDCWELSLIRAAVHRAGLPILCICRGMQILNVALGGDLVQHIPDRFGEQVPHRDPERRPVHHDVRVEATSQIAALCGGTTLTVRSFHHQAVDGLGQGLRAVAWSTDGVVEAVEHVSHPWVIAVQWHPEHDAVRDPKARGLFDAFVAQAARPR